MNVATGPAPDGAAVPSSGRRILFVLFEGLPATVIDTQVLLHVRAAQASFGVRFEVWSFCGMRSLYESSMRRWSEAERLANGPVRVFRGVRAGMPGSKLINREIFRAILRQRAGDFDLVHARNDYTAAVVGPPVHDAGLRMIWDCRGDSVAQFDEGLHSRRYPGWLLRMRRRVICRERELAARDCNSALFVSRPLATLCTPLLGGKPHWVIPCAAPDELFHFDPALRRKVRQDLGYADSDRVFIYSGGLASYQCIPEMLSLFRDLYSVDANARLLFVTPDVESARAMCGGIDPEALQVRSGRASDINGFLNAADAAFMLRAHNGINRAAFPTKFAEYCLAGLPVIMDDAVPDCASLADLWGNRLSLDVCAILDRMRVGIDRAGVGAMARSEVTRSAAVPRYAQAYGIGS
jgi:hypothetical protein